MIFRRPLTLNLRPAALVIFTGLTLAGCGQSPRLGSSTSGVNLPGASGTTYPGAPGSGETSIVAALPAGAEDTNTLTPETRTIRVADLPKPSATPDVNNPPQVVARPDGAKLSVPAGFAVYEWARDLENPRAVAVAPNGDVFVTESGPGRVVVLKDANNDGKAEAKEVFADGLKQPFGVAFYPPGSPSPTHVYVANTDSVVRFAYKNGDLKATGKAETIVSDLPGGGYNQHWTRNIAFRPDGKKMYVSVGSQSNASEGEDEKRAAVLEYNPDGTGYRVFASGLRNPVGIAFQPQTNTLWAAVNERDGLGEDLVPDYVTSVRENGFYGWPYTYLGANDEPRLPDKPELAQKAIVPDVLIGSHAAALGLAFYTGASFPSAYKNGAFVALHGSWNRAERSGYQVVRVPVGADGKAAGGYEEFLSGWKTKDGTVWGRPVAVAVDKQGGLLITDDGANKVWRVLYGGEKAVAAARKQNPATATVTNATKPSEAATAPALDANKPSDGAPTAAGK